MAGTKQDGFGSYSLENAALGLLINGPKHGYGLYQDFCSAFARIWKAGQANFYAALASLETKGYLQSSAEPQAGRPARRVYQITDTGREAFFDWLHRPVSSLRSIRVELIAKLRFFHRLGLSGAPELIDDQVAILQHMLDEWKQAVDSVSEEDQYPFPDIVDDFRKRQAGFIVEWLRAWRGHFLDI